MDDFATVQMEMQASINSQTSTMHDFFGHFRINPDAYILLKFKLGGDVMCPGMSPRLSHSIPSFSSYLSLVLPVGRTTVIAMIASKYCFH
jgi:hypothetical protein